MYQFDYFMDQVEMEEHDNRISDGGLLRALEALTGGSINTRSPIFTLPSQKWRMISTITQIPSLIPHSQNINTTVRKSKELIQEIGNDFSKRKEDESVSGYLQRLCRGTDPIA